MFTKNKVQISTYMVMLIPFVLLGIFASGLFSFSDLTLMNIGDKVMYLLYHIWEYKRFFNEKTMMCIGWSVILWVFLCSYIMYHFRDFHSDIQNGSEEWADPYEVTKRRANPDDSLNRIISKNVKISTQGNGAPSNNNMVVVGSSGKYKTTSIVISNSLNSSANQITLDVKGEIMYKLGLYITKIQHKTIRCLNLKYPELSDRYNPFAYIECEEDIINLIENIYDSLTPPDAMVNDPFWPEGAKLYLQSLFYYEWWYAKKEGRKGSINNILVLINDETKKDTTIKVQKGQQPPSYLQLKMDKLAKEDSPDNPAVRDYRKLKEGAAETVRSIIIIVNAKLKLFETAALKRIFEDDDMNLREFGTGVGGTLENPTNNRLVLFICVDDREKSFHFIASMLYTQVLTILCRMADDDFKENGGALPIPLEMLLDEFYAGAKPSNTVELMGVIRSRNISMIPILQSTSQLKDLFKAEKAEIIYDNVPVLCFCGAGQGAIESHKYISELLGNSIDKGFFTKITNKDLPVKRNKNKKDYKKIHRIKKACAGTSIEDRPEDILEREEFGHMEMDSVIGKREKGSTLLTIIERKTRNIIVKKQPDKTSKSVVETLDELERELGDVFYKLFKTITVDNGTEFADCEGIERSCVYPGKKRTKVYYCHPYASCERGSNENGNRMIRRKIPKGTSINGYSEEEIQQIEDWVNEYPRRMFGYRSSKDLYKEEMKYLI